ncbi:hypothetical protein EO98_13125 [Methanosarcina sp. 2.H.T.1A.6]|nr:hypothetical protein EO94_03005 [Methanosarcina sp. 2.H.T.1A.3]KKG18748.1 hypothetical protein EO97_02045 [Methanosarcina sp. 2.H.T.1A.15]KKG22424.1 hypothetical protein EO96_08420 [Methanosarcina sp. 2.H.T.1A.8]KKG23578.1 hypothetical protein EO98_13125 [Methanosarcina sp. 2.H.T.1A.6]
MKESYCHSIKHILLKKIYTTTKSIYDYEEYILLWEVYDIMESTYHCKKIYLYKKYMLTDLNVKKHNLTKDIFMLHGGI